ncbi:IS1595 family transposase [Leucobacter insecticola]|uniref:IS1595 family transposase n=1 Tax=Leucobacter insecticola TaxID=2714934 RepID=A0A6G8FJC2_9MICO|nr:IS1595 family transposase [Leucobacter insecticola]
MLPDVVGLVASRDYPTDTTELQSWFGTDESCLDYLEWLRWPSGFLRPRCGEDSAAREGGRYRCRCCRKRVSVTSGTVFDKTRIPLSVWFEVVWLVASSREGVSASSLHRDLPIASYQTAWAMLGKLRRIMPAAAAEPLTGRVEVGVIALGRLQPGTVAPGTGPETHIACAIELDPQGRGRVRLALLSNRTAAPLRDFVEANVALGSTIISRSRRMFTRAIEGYRHVGPPAWPRGNPATRSAVQRVFMLLRRMLSGTYRNAGSVEHLMEYLDEFVFRFNLRNCRDRGLVFMWLLRCAVRSEPTTYRELVQEGSDESEDVQAPIVHPWRQDR